MIAILLITVSVFFASVKPLDARLPTLWDTAWILPLADRETVDDYLEGRARQGFDAILMGISDFGLDNSRPLGNRQKLFLADRGPIGTSGQYIGDVTRPNEAGFQHIDYILQKAASLNLKVPFLPVSNGGSGNYVAALTDAYPGENRAYNYGWYIGSRYRNYSNVIWVLGGDVSEIGYPEIPALTYSLANGLRAAGADQPITFHHGWNPDGQGSTLDAFPPDGQWLDFNMVQHRTSYEQLIRNGYYEAKGREIGLGEGPPDGSTKYPIEQIRAEPYQVLLAGGSYYAYAHGDIFYGRNYSTLKTQGLTYTMIAISLMKSRGWRSYVPDESFVTREGGNTTVYGGRKIAAIKTNSAAMIYLANSSSYVIVDMSRLNASGQVRARRFNPVNGSSSYIGDYPASGTQKFDTGGLADAVILLDAVP